jgi:hypothetical protein
MIKVHEFVTGKPILVDFGFVTAVEEQSRPNTIQGGESNYSVIYLWGQKNILCSTFEVKESVDEIIELTRKEFE